MINLEQVRQLQSKVQEAVQLIGLLNQENSDLKEKISFYEGKISELQSSMDSIKEDQHEIEEGIKEALAQLGDLPNSNTKDSFEVISSETQSNEKSLQEEASYSLGEEEDKEEEDHEPGESKEEEKELASDSENSPVPHWENDEEEDSQEDHGDSLGIF